MPGSAKVRETQFVRFTEFRRKTLREKQRWVETPPNYRQKTKYGRLETKQMQLVFCYLPAGVDSLLTKPRIR